MTNLSAAQVVRAFNGRLFFVVALLMLSQINYGMDMTAFGATQAMTAFETKFGHHWDPKTKRYTLEPYFLSLLNSLTYVGQVVGVISGGWISRHYGRRWALWSMCCWAFLAAILLVTAQTKEQMLVARILNYVFMGQELATIPVMQSEIVPPHIRGLVVGTYQLGTMLGAFISSLICYGTSTIDGDASFRIPLGLFFVIPSIVFVGIFFVPESPRWLLIKDRHEDAMVSLRKYRQGAFTEDQITEELKTQVAFIGMKRDQGNFWEMWKGTNLRRSLVVIGCNVCIQISGQGFASKYGTIFIKDIGAINPFVMTCINTSIFIVVVVVAMYLTDRVGRRPLLLIGSFIQTGSFLAMGGLATSNPLSRAYKIGITAMLTVFYSAFCFGWAPVYHIISAEVPSSRMRDVTYVTASLASVVCQFVVSFSIPYLLYPPYAALGAKVGLIFGPIAFVTLVFAYFFVPECKGLSLEEIDHLFQQRVPLRKFGKHRHGEVLPEGTVEVMAAEKVGPTIEQREVA